MDNLFQIIFASVFGIIAIVALSFAFWLALGDTDEFIYRRKARKYYRIKNRIKRLQNHLTYLDIYYFDKSSYRS